MARRLAECGEAIGFYESDGLVWVRMYEDWHETWRNWPRSLPTRDQYFGWHEATGLLEVLLIQSLPLPLLADSLMRSARRVGWSRINLTRSYSPRRPDGRREGIRAETLDLLAFPAARSSSSARADHECFAGAARYGAVESMCDVPAELSRP